MGFTEDSLAEYIENGKATPQEMSWLKKLLFSELKVYCTNCENDRMLCVLSPACTERILLKVRLQTGGLKEDLPQFCYSQNITNLRRYLEKKTTLYEPMDVLIFNEDFLEILFPGLANKIVKMYDLKNLESSIREIHKMIKKTKIPAINFEDKIVDAQLFNRIMERDKMIKEGTFIYQINNNHLLIWFEGVIFLSSFSSGLTICNAKKDLIPDLQLLDIVYHIYCAEQNISGKSKFESENEITMTIEFGLNDIDQDLSSENSPYFVELFESLQSFFYRVNVHVDEKNTLVIVLSYQNVDSLLNRIGLSKITYDALHNIIKKFAKLKTNS